MDLPLFSEGWFSKPDLSRYPNYDGTSKAKPQQQHSEPAHADPHPSDDIAAFHAKHKELEEIAKRLHKSGHHIHIDYKSPNVVRHGNKSGTHFFNAGLNTEKKIQISKKVPLRPW